MADTLPSPPISTSVVQDPKDPHKTRMEFTPVWVKWLIDLTDTLNNTAVATGTPGVPGPPGAPGAPGSSSIPQTARESAAGVVPVDTSYAPGNVLRYGANTNGAVNSTLAFSQALLSSDDVFIPEGTFLLNSLVVDVAGLSGKVITGASNTKTILKASAAATNFVQVKGNYTFAPPSGYYNENNILERFTIDMSLMADSAASRGLYMSDNWGVSVRNVIVKSQPASGSSLYVGPTTYTCVYDNCDFGSTTGTIRLIGDSGGALVTTQTFIGCAFARCIAVQASSLTFLQPIVQGILDKFDLSEVYNVSILSGDIEGTGTYLKLGANVNGLVSTNNAIIGFTGTYQTGTFLSGYTLDQTNDPYRIIPPGGMTVDSPIKEQSSAALVRKYLSSTSGPTRQIDIATTNSAGAQYAGLTTTGDSYLDNRGSGKLVLQQSGTDRLGVTADAKLLVGTITAATASAGAAGDVPVQVTGYLVIDIGGTPFKVPYYAN